jgi:predicted nucleic acid-binding protein
VNLFEFAFVQNVPLEKMKKYERWLESYGIRVLPLSKKASETFQNLAKVHKPPSNRLADMLTASISLAEGGVLATRNIVHFIKIKGLLLVSEFAIEKI